MGSDLTNQISLIVFFVIVGFFALISILAVFIFIRYGRKPSFTVAASLVFGALFFLGTITAFVTLQNIF